MSLKRHLDKTRKLVFKKSIKKIKKSQTQYVKDYAKRNQIKKKFPHTVGARVQYRNTRNDQRMGGKFDPKWFPIKSFLIVKKINFERNFVELRNRKGRASVKFVHFNNIRSFPGSRKTSRKKVVSRRKK